jgi:hypothetical protein
MPRCGGPEVTATREGTAVTGLASLTDALQRHANRGGRPVARVLNRPCRDLIEPLYLNEAL